MPLLFQEYSGPLSTVAFKHNKIKTTVIKIDNSKCHFSNFVELMKG